MKAKTTCLLTVKFTKTGLSVNHPGRFNEILSNLLFCCTYCMEIFRLLVNLYFLKSNSSVYMPASRLNSEYINKHALKLNNSTPVFAVDSTSDPLTFIPSSATSEFYLSWNVNNAARL